MFPLIPIISALSSAIDAIIPEDKKPLIQPILDQHQVELEKAFADSEARVAEAQASVIIAETKGGLLERTWRPVLCYMIITMIFINYGIGSVISFYRVFRPIDLPPQLWTLIQICLPGYIALRSHEKTGLPGSELVSKVVDKVLR